MSKRKPKDCRDNSPSTTEITVTARGAFLALATRLRVLSQLHHLNRTFVHFQFDDGKVETYTIWPGNGDPEEHKRACDQLNWSEH